MINNVGFCKRTAIVVLSFSIAVILFFTPPSSASVAGPNQPADKKPAGNQVKIYPHEKWALAKPEEVGLKADKLAELDEFLESCGDSSGLILRHGKIAHTWGDINKQYDVASCTKSFTSTAIGLAIADKKLSLDDKIYKFVPEVNSPKDKNITIAHLLSMTSEYGRPGQPGEAWSYSGAVELLSPIFNARYNITMADFMKSRVLDPIGAKNWQWPSMSGPAGKSYSVAAGGINISASDMARFGYLFLNDGNWEGKNLVPKEWIAVATRSSQELNSAYGYLWWVNTYTNWPMVPKDAYCALGQQSRDVLFICPSLDLVAVYFGEKSLGDEQKLPDFLFLTVNSVQD